VISDTEGRDLAKHFGCRFIETSAKQRINVDEAFSNLVREIRKYNKVRLCSIYTFCPFGSCALLCRPSVLTLPFRILRNNKLAVPFNRVVLTLQVHITTPMGSTKEVQAVAEVAWLRKICKRFDHAFATYPPFFPIFFLFRLYYTLGFIVASLHDISWLCFFCALTLDIPYTTRVPSTALAVLSEGRSK